MKLIDSIFRSNILLICLTFLFVGETVRAQTVGSPLDGFDPDVAGWIDCLAVNPEDGSILIGGLFSHVSGEVRGNLARLHADGSVDQSFSPSTNGRVRSIAIDRNGRILVGGQFSEVNSANRNGIARLDSAGNLDSGFDPGFSGFVLAISYDPTDDSSIVCGDLDNREDGTSKVVRVRTDGSLDPNFSATLDLWILTLTILEDGKILIGGSFSNIDGVPMRYLARLHPDGSLDPGFNSQVDNPVYALECQTDGKILVGTGGFLEPDDGRGISRLHPDGSLDESFTAYADSDVYAIAIQPDGRILIGGFFYTVNGQERLKVARLDCASGALDPSFQNPLDSDFGNALYAISVQSDGKIVFAGDFDTWLDPHPRKSIARIYPNGAIDADFTPAADSSILSLLSEPDGSLIAAGAFSDIDRQSRSRIARFFVDGSLDPDFTPAVNANVFSTFLQPDGKILIAGAFTSVNSTTRNYLARLNHDGSLDTSFNPNPNGIVRTVSLQPDGKILIGGDFTSVGGVARNRIARLNPNGSLDGQFNASANDSVYVAVTLSNGKIMIGGSFTNYSGNIRNRIAQLESDGSTDSGFAQSVGTGTVNAIVEMENGEVYIGGDFDSVGGTGRSNFACLAHDGALIPTSLDFNHSLAIAANIRAFAKQADGKVIAVGDFETVNGSARRGIARILPNRTLDPDFVPMPNSSVATVALQKDGKAVIGGDFTIVDGVARARIARLTNGHASSDFSIDEASNGDPNQFNFTWQNGGASPAVDHISFEISLDGGNNWIAPPQNGSGVIENVENLHFGEPVFVRVTGRQFSKGTFFAGGSIFKSTYKIFLAPTYRPDLWTGPRLSRMRGNNVYNASGAGQIFSLRSKRNAKFLIRAENDGNATDSLRVRGKKTNRKFKFKYFKLSGGRQNVTGAVGAGRYLASEIAPESSELFQAQMKPRFMKGKTKGQTVKPAVSSTGHPTTLDVGKAKIKVQR